MPRPRLRYSFDSKELRSPGFCGSAYLLPGCHAPPDFTVTMPRTRRRALPALPVFRTSANSPGSLPRKYSFDRSGGCLAKYT